jgi:hypothetical protein
MKDCGITRANSAAIPKVNAAEAAAAEGESQREIEAEVAAAAPAPKLHMNLMHATQDFGEEAAAPAEGTFVL